MRTTPYLFKSERDIILENIRKLPLLNTKDINGYELIETYFVDSSGFGDEKEPAMTINSFIKQIKVGYAYGIVDAGQFQVYVGEFRKIKKHIDETEYLIPKYDIRKSFYKKAVIIRENNLIILKSYQIIVAQIENNKPKVFGFYSLTTMRHIKEFLKQFGFKVENTKQILKDYS